MDKDIIVLVTRQAKMELFLVQARIWGKYGLKNKFDFFSAFFRFLAIISSILKHDKKEMPCRRLKK